MVVNCYLKVYAYMYTHSGGFAGPRKPVPKYDLTLVQLLVPEGQEPVVKQLGKELELDDVERDIAIWKSLLNCEVKYFKEKRVTTVTEEQAEELPKAARGIL